MHRTALVWIAASLCLHVASTASAVRLEEVQEMCKTFANDKPQPERPAFIERCVKIATEGQSVSTKPPAMSAGECWTKYLDAKQRTSDAKKLAELDKDYDKCVEPTAKQADRERAQRRKQGVNIGMTEGEVLESSWGKPRSINKSHGSWGTHSQWVYDGGYLYFENGKLTSISN